MGTSRNESPSKTTTETCRTGEHFQQSLSGARVGKQFAVCPVGGGGKQLLKFINRCFSPLEKIDRFQLLPCES